MGDFKLHVQRFSKQMLLVGELQVQQIISVCIMAYS